MTTIERISRAEWPRDEIRMLDEALTANALPDGPPVSIERSQFVARRAERDRLQAELNDLSFGGRIDFHLTGEAVDDHLSVLSDIVSASGSPDVAVAMGSAVDDLSLSVIRSITSLVSNLKSQKLTLNFRWTNPTGKVRTGSLDPMHTGDLQRALRASEEDRSSRQVHGELRGLSLEGRRTFQIRVGDGSMSLDMWRKMRWPASSASGSGNTLRRTWNRSAELVLVRPETPRLD